MIGMELGVSFDGCWINIENDYTRRPIELTLKDKDDNYMHCRVSIEKLPEIARMFNIMAKELEHVA